MADISENIDQGEIWLSDALRVIDSPGFFITNEVDMSNCKALIERLRDDGIKVTYTHIFIRAVALVLSSHSELHQLIKNNHRIIPEMVDIGLSVAANEVVAPVLVIQAADRKSLRDIAKEVTELAPEAMKKQKIMLAKSRKWGWIIPLGWIRRFFLRLMVNQLWFVRREVGTFQISCLHEVDQFVPFLFSTAAILGTGRVRERVVAINGKQEIRSTVFLSCCVDHKIWDGVRAAKFLKELTKLLESADME